jgi:hypothetical protein
VAPFFDERTAQHIRPPKRAVRRADGLGKHGSHYQPTTGKKGQKSVQQPREAPHTLVGCSNKRAAPPLALRRRPTWDGRRERRPYELGQTADAAFGERLTFVRSEALIYGRRWVEIEPRPTPIDGRSVAPRPRLEVLFFYSGRIGGANLLVDQLLRSQRHWQRPSLYLRNPGCEKQSLIRPSPE